MSSAAAGSCSVCGGRLGAELLRVTEPDRFERHLGISSLGYERSWVECGSCGAASNIHQPGNRELLDGLAAGYYDVDFAGTSIAEKYEKVMSLPAEKSDNAQRVDRIAAFADGWLSRRPEPWAVLDIGAGTGVFLSRLTDRDRERWAPYAIEPDPAAAEHLRALGRFPVTEAMFSSELNLVDFDLVTLNKVVEHVPNPVALLRDAASALSDPLGLLYVEVPDKITINHRAASDNILGALHCHLYDPVSLGVLLDRAGFVPLRIDRVFEPSGKLSVTAFATLSPGVRAVAGEKGTA